MGENSAIEWCDHTFNPWIGCQAISPACDNCYAAAWVNGRLRGDFSQRRRTVADNWRKPLRWDRMAKAAGVRHRVFCASLADVFDNQVPDEWRADLWDLIQHTEHLDWLLLTKRPQNIARMLPQPATGWQNPEWPWPNVWLGTTVENQAEADRRIPQLLAVPAARHFLSCEPLLGPVDLKRFLRRGDSGLREADPLAAFLLREAEDDGTAWVRPRIDWVIAGGESGPKARPTHPDWARDLRDQCAAADMPFFFKQWGEWTPGENAGGPMTRSEHAAWWWNGEWEIRRMTPRESEEMHTDDEPDVYRVGKRRAGALLDGCEHREVPHG
jgi:protein gp37